MSQKIESKDEQWWDRVMFKDTLLERSGRNFKGGDILLGAQKYYCMQELEKSALETEFKDYIFFVY